MAYPQYTSSSGIKTSTTVKEAGANGENYVYAEAHIQNQSESADLFLKWGADCSDSNFDYRITVGSPPIVLTNVPDSQVISAASDDLKYTFTIR